MEYQAAIKRNEVDLYTLLQKEFSNKTLAQNTT